MTQAITHRRVLRIALPIVLSHASVPLLGVVDTGVIGRLGEAAPIGAVGLGTLMLGTVYWLFGFLRMGTVGLAAQAIGAGEHEEQAAVLWRAVLIATAAGAILIALQGVIFWLAFRVSPASSEVEALARSYMEIRIWSAPAPIMIYGMSGWLLAHQRTDGVLLMQFGMNLLNIVLNIWFVMGLGWGVQGVATATLIAEFSGLSIGLWLCRGALLARINWTRILDVTRLLRLANVSRDIFLRTILIQAVFLSFVFTGADLGDTTLAANQVLLQFLFIGAYLLDGFAATVETLVGQAFGARDKTRLRQSVRIGGFWCLMVGCTMMGIYAVAGGWIIEMLTTSEEVRQEAKKYLLFATVAPLVGAGGFFMDGVFVGATQSRAMRNMMFLSASLFFVLIWFLIPLWGNSGLWWSFLAFFLSRGVTLGLCYPSLARKMDTQSQSARPLPTA